MEKLKIGFFIDTYFPMIDGVVTVVDNYARRLSARNEVTVFCPAYPGKSFDDSSLPYRVVRCRSVGVPLLDYSLPEPDLDEQFEQKLNEVSLDVVHIHSPFTVGKAGIKYARRHGIPVVATMHSQFRQDIAKMFHLPPLVNALTHRLARTFDRCDECWAVNAEIARLFHEEYGCKKMPKVMGNATEMTPVSHLDDAKTAINSLCHISPDQKVFLFVGRINSLKNVFFTVDALAALTKRPTTQAPPAFPH
ncbi:MAG: glycosyltransferase, partial [Clostridia bacterium]|nr:glycosyltransferase [Clostridia bacterium]